VTVRVAMWSGPRNISTALMRSWENRPDTVVVDEPFYAAFLARTGAVHPGREAVLASQPLDEATVLAGLLSPLPDECTVHYAKQMTHHLDPAADRSWMSAFRNVVLVREPREVVASYVRSREHCQPDDLGLRQQVALLEDLGDPPVIDSADFLGDPESYLRWLCDWLGIGFTERMLTWPAGPRDTDGVWAPYWYGAVLASTGFQRRRAGEVSLSPEQNAVAEACRPAYELLHSRRVVV
jgi:hypothetical protein